MMNERRYSERSKEVDLETRLTAYYGPELREQPLPPSSWLHLRSQLGRQSSSRYWFIPGLRRPRSLHYRPTMPVPGYVQEAFSRILYEARVTYVRSMLHCRFKAHVREPKVRVSPLGRCKIRLILPSQPERSIGQAELDVLLATGLARYLCRCVRRPIYTVMGFLTACAGLLAYIAIILFWRVQVAVEIVPIAILLCVLWLLHREGRTLAIQADTLVVRWLGRSQVCRGLHALVRRSSTRSRRAWFGLSLAERIDRVCGTQVAMEDECLTLVR